MTLDVELPIEDIGRMTRAQRIQRLAHLVQDSTRIMDAALDEHLDGHDLAAVVWLFSGGNDSTVLGHVMRDRITHAGHANTGIGIEDTRQFVRDTCREWGVPLLEKYPPTSYRELVLDRGFPGPAFHWKMYQRLKERCLVQIRRDFVADPRRQRVLFLAGRRRAESTRRAQIVEHERRGSIIWASPLANWTKLDMNSYRVENLDVPRNDVADLLHMSGECLCGAFAKPGELDMIGWFYPEVAEEIRALEREVTAAGHPPELCVWGNGHGRAASRQTGMLCSSCDARQEVLPGVGF